MLLSKQEFSKLSRRDQMALANNRGNQPLKKNNNKRKVNKQLNRDRNVVMGPRITNGSATTISSAFSTSSRSKPAIVKATRDTCNIKHKEFVGNITGSVAFAIAASFAVNPGLSATFPWLSIMAQGWEEYRFRNLRFVYKTRTGSGTPGSVMIAPDYDSADAPPSSEQVMTTYSQCIEDAVWNNIICVLKTDNENPLGKRHFVRSAVLAANLDIKTYDIANVFVGTVDGTAVAWGKLWVEYDIDFFIPQLPALGAALVVGGAFTSTNGETAANPMGTAPTTDPQASGITVDALSVFTFSVAGTYLVAIQMIGTVITDIILTGTASAVVTGLQVALVNAAGTTADRNFQVVVSAVPTTVAFTATATTVTDSQVRFAVAPLGSLS